MSFSVQNTQPTLSGLAALKHMEVVADADLSSVTGAGKIVSVLAHNYTGAIDLSATGVIKIKDDYKIPSGTAVQILYL